VSKGIYENTLSAARAAVEGGYNIELDIQPSSDMVPMVFHDYELERLTSESGETRSIAAQTLTKISIKDTKDKIPTLKEFLKVIDGKVGLVIELKGRKNEDEGFVAAIADLLSDYKGDAVTMSFEHAEGDDRSYEKHKSIAQECDVDFISYYVKELDCKFVREFVETGRPSISWTIRTP